MSVAQTAHRPAGGRRTAKLWAGFLIVIGAGIALAWFGAQEVRANTVQVDTVQAGSGPLVTVNDGVLIEYEARLENGEVFDSTEGRGPAPVLPSQVIPGFSQALQKMQEGGRYQVSIPSKLAYGSTPPPGAPIPPDADLSFDVHVVRVVPNAALMQAMQGQPGQP